MEITSKLYLSIFTETYTNYPTEELNDLIEELQYKKYGQNNAK